MASYMPAIVFGVVALLVISVQLDQPSKTPWVLGGALLGSAAAIASPWVLNRYTQTVLGDNTFNFGAAFLMWNLPAIVPIGAGLGSVFGSIFEALVGTRREGKSLSGEQSDD